MRWKDRLKVLAAETVAEHGGRPQAIFVGFVTATAGIILFIFGLDAFSQDENSGAGVERWIYLVGALVGLVATASQFLIIAEMTKEVASSEAK